MTRALSIALLGGMLTLPSMCNVYRSDVTKLCDAEQLSQGSIKANRSAVFTWMEHSVGSSEAIILVRELEGKDMRGIAVALHEEARKVGLTACALADQAEMQAKDDDFHADIVNLCAGSAAKSDGSIARLEILGADDAERMRELVAWSSTNAKSPDTAGVVAKVTQAQPRQRGAVLRAEAAKVGVTSCLMASTLDAPQPAMAPVGPQINPNFTVLKVDGPLKNQFPIAHMLVGRDEAAAINACYAIALAGTPTLTGKVVMRLAFDAPGHVMKADDDGSTVKGPLFDCIRTAMQGDALPAPLPDGKKGAKATVTLQLTPSTSGPGFAAIIEPGFLAKSTPKRR